MHIVGFWDVTLYSSVGQCQCCRKKYSSKITW